MQNLLIERIQLPKYRFGWMLYPARAPYINMI